MQRNLLIYCCIFIYILYLHKCYVLWILCIHRCTIYVYIIYSYASSLLQVLQYQVTQLFPAKVIRVPLWGSLSFACANSALSRLKTESHVFVFLNMFQKMFVCIELWVPWKQHKWSVLRRRVRISDVFGINWSCSPFARARRRWAVCFPVGSQVKPDISRHVGRIETE